MNENEIRKANRIFIISFGISLAMTFVLIALGHYWLGITIGYGGAFCAAVFMRNVSAKLRLGDERSDLIEGKADALTLKITIPSLAALFVILGGLSSELDMKLPAYPIIGPLFTFICLTQVFAYRYYSRKYG